MTRRHVRTTTLLVAALLTIGVASSSLADVRIAFDRGPDPELQVEVAPRGPWSLIGPLDNTVLNPSGDLFADGLPGNASAGPLVFASWVRPVAGEVRLAQWDDGGWAEYGPVAEPTAVGVPDVAPVGLGWAMTWQRSDASGAGVAAAGASTDGESGEPTFLVPGVLIDSTFVGDVQYLITRTEDGMTTELSAIQWNAVPSVPSPIDVLWTIVLDRPEERSAGIGAPSGEWGFVGASDDGAVLRWGRSHGRKFQLRVTEDGLAELVQGPPGRGLGRD